MTMEYHQTYAQENREAWIDAAQMGECGAQDCGKPIAWGEINEDGYQYGSCTCPNNPYLYSRRLSDGTVTIEE